MSIQTADYHKAWRDKHPDRIKEYYQRDYAKRRESIRLQRSEPDFKEKRNAYLKSWREKNHERHRAAMKAWYEAHKNTPEFREKKREYSRRQYQKNRAKEIERGKLYVSKNRDKVRFRFRRLRKTSVQFCLKDRLRAVMGRALRRQFAKKSKRTMELIGCTPEFLRNYIEGQFLPGMTWENRRLWHVDHIKPLASFDLRDPEVQKVAFHYTNLQPLWAKDNQQKSDKVLVG